jgi:hypothetical protein
MLIPGQRRCSPQVVIKANKKLGKRIYGRMMVSMTPNSALGASAVTEVASGG